MPKITITYTKQSGEVAGDAYDAARKLLEAEKLKHPGIEFSNDPAWTETSQALTAVLPGKVDPDYIDTVEEPVIEEPKPKAKRKFSLRKKK